MFDKEIFDRLAEDVKVAAYHTNEAVNTMLVAKKKHSEATFLHGQAREAFRNHIKKHSGVTL